MIKRKSLHVQSPKERNVVEIASSTTGSIKIKKWMANVTMTFTMIWRISFFPDKVGCLGESETFYTYMLMLCLFLLKSIMLIRRPLLHYFYLTLF